MEGTTTLFAEFRTHTRATGTDLPWSRAVLLPTRPKPRMGLLRRRHQRTGANPRPRRQPLIHQARCASRPLQALPFRPHGQKLQPQAVRPRSESWRGRSPCPSESAAVPSRPGAVPSRSGAVPSRSGAVPSESAAVPSESAAVPSESGLAVVVRCGEPVPGAGELVRGAGDVEGSQSFLAATGHDQGPARLAGRTTAHRDRRRTPPRRHSTWVGRRRTLGPRQR